MSAYLIQDSTLFDIANAIREKTNTSALINPINMADSIRSIENNIDFNVEERIITQQVTIEETTNGNVLLLENNQFALDNRDDENLFVLLTPLSLNSVTNSSFTGYQWTTMFSGNKELSKCDGYNWYGLGIYLYVGKGYTYPSTAEISYPLTESSAISYSYLNISENGDVQAYICSYDIISGGDYMVTVGVKK